MKKQEIGIAVPVSASGCFSFLNLRVSVREEILAGNSRGCFDETMSPSQAGAHDRRLRQAVFRCAWSAMSERRWAKGAYK